LYVPGFFLGFWSKPVVNVGRLDFYPKTFLQPSETEQKGNAVAAARTRHQDGAIPHSIAAKANLALDVGFEAAHWIRYPHISQHFCNAFDAMGLQHIKSRPL
jgi:hypothetical protein